MGAVLPSVTTQFGDVIIVESQSYYGIDCRGMNVVRGGEEERVRTCTSWGDFGQMSN